MSFPVSRLCPRLLFCALRKPISCLHSNSLLKQQRFCSTLSDAKLGDPTCNFEEFEEIPATNELLASIDIEAIARDDLEKQKSLQVFISELKMLMQTQKMIAPKHLTIKQWETLLNMKNDAFRASYLKRLYYKENKKRTRAAFSKEKEEDLRKYRESQESIPKVPPSTCSPISYKLGETTLFHRVYKQTIKQRLNFDLAMAMYFGPDLVVDCSYEKYMTSSEIYGCARQMLFMWSSNRDCKSPFNLVFCNINPNGKLMKHLMRFFHDAEDDSFMLNLTEKSYTDLYPAEQLVYLTPHCDEELEKYDGDSTYIIGAYVDEIVNKPVSVAKARRDGLRTAKFPLEKNLNWAQGSKLLPINQCLSIMYDLKDGAEWEYALRHVATRKQSFQTCGSGNNLKLSDRQAAVFVREQARRDMLRDLNVKEIFKKKDKNSLDDDIL